MEIRGRSCIVTGASSGVGAATALAAELPGTCAATTDVADPEDLRRLVLETVDTFGSIDVLVNNAGQGLHVPILELDPVDLRAVFELNVVAPLVATQFAITSGEAHVLVGDLG